MNRIRLVILILITLPLCFALLIEVVNPHSFLQHTGAFLRGAVITAAVPFWVWLSWKKWDWISKVGLGTMTVAALLYWNYGVWDLCDDNWNLLESHERSDGVSLFGRCSTVFTTTNSPSIPPWRPP